MMAPRPQQAQKYKKTLNCRTIQVFVCKSVVLYAQMLCFATLFDAARSPKSNENNAKVKDCWSKTSFEVQNYVTVTNSADFIEKTLRLSAKVLEGCAKTRFRAFICP